MLPTLSRRRLGSKPFGAQGSPARASRLMSQGDGAANGALAAAAGGGPALPGAAPGGAEVAPPLLDEAGVGDEVPDKVKKVYLVTFPHPRAAGLRAPGSMARAEVWAALEQAVASTNAQRATPLQLKQGAVFREKHGNGQLHDHVCVLADRTFRFGPVKTALRDQHRLASHWSTSHEGYHSCVAYCYVPSPKKPQGELDEGYYLWPEGAHPPLSEASKPPFRVAAAWAGHREKARLTQAEKGKPERFEELDIWPVVIRENILPGPAAPDIVMAYAKRCGGEAMVSYCFRNFNRLPDLVQRCWRVERVEETVAEWSKTRMDVLVESQERPCVCGGAWPGAAVRLLRSNGINEATWQDAVLYSLEHGRSKGHLVCHAGLDANEGKSWMLEPLEAVFGGPAVFSTPAKGGFPLLGLEDCRVVVLDDWRFNQDVLGYPLQLLWFEGKAIVIARPQNAYAGHLRYTGDAPIFITTLRSDIAHMSGKGILSGDVSMMLARLKIFDFHCRIPDGEAKVPACARCFARFLLRGRRPRRPAGGPAGESPVRQAPRRSETENLTFL